MKFCETGSLVGAPDPHGDEASTTRLRNVRKKEDKKEQRCHQQQQTRNLQTTHFGQDRHHDNDIPPHNPNTNRLVSIQLNSVQIVSAHLDQDEKEP